MKKQIFFLLLFVYFFLANPIYCQIEEKPTKEKSVSKLFKSQELLNIKLNYSNKEVKKNTNDSTYINSNLAYEDTDGTWKNIEVGLRARGNFRRKNCYFSPIKLKIKNLGAPSPQARRWPGFEPHNFYFFIISLRLWSF
jgi:hypothetical protein